MGKRWIFYGLLGTGALATLVAARPITAAILDAGGIHRPWAGRWAAHWGHEGMSPEAAKEHLQVATKWALRDVDASQAIAADAVDDLFRLRQRHLENREAFHAQLGGASVDRAALEEIRKSEMALADEASKRVVQALADVSEVLTPEQRQALIARHHRQGS